MIGRFLLFLSLFTVGTAQNQDFQINLQISQSAQTTLFQKKWDFDFVTFHNDSHVAILGASLGPSAYITLTANSAVSLTIFYTTTPLFPGNVVVPLGPQLCQTGYMYTFFNSTFVATQSSAVGYNQIGITNKGFWSIGLGWGWTNNNNNGVLAPESIRRIEPQGSFIFSTQPSYYLTFGPKASINAMQLNATDFGYDQPQLVQLDYQNKASYSFDFATGWTKTVT
eukprot:TRINITY_DN19441_c0_g1_i1.p1 TRINITY_DN19441_c0_g1~~TRINITY_DN19441_c0_g1_i1.p1  ORF type:complete len:225 (-),score=12.67 TRINITY_DN19441_c0_g1_i1:116-790(-)